MTKLIRTGAALIVLGGILLLSVVLLVLRFDLDIGLGISGGDALPLRVRAASEDEAAQNSDQQQKSAGDLLTIIIDDGTPVSSIVEPKVTKNIPE